MIRSILVPLDGSSFSERALPLATWIARRSGARLRLVHVRLPAALFPQAGVAPIDVAAERGLRDRARAYLEAVSRRVEDEAGVAGDVVLLEGPVAETLDGEAEREHIDLIVMTTHGRGGLERAWLGSVADRLIRQTRRPVLLVRPRGEEPADAGIRRILVALDGSELAERVLAPAMELARLGDAELALVRVVSPIILTDFATGGLGVFVDQEDLAYRRRVAEAYLNAIAERLRHEGVAAAPAVVEHPQPALAILERADTVDADVVAVATHGRGGFNRLFLGSVADKVVRGAKAPVLVLRPETS